MSILFDPRPRGANADRDFLSGFALPAEPTGVQPGSAAKIHVLRERYRQRVALHHPDDARDVLTGWRLLAAIRLTVWRDGENT